jgi:hypothetical protein
MDHRKTTLERAFELAKSGIYANFAEVRTKIKSEGYDIHQMEGAALRRQINQIIQSARSGPGPGTA